MTDGPKDILNCLTDALPETLDVPDAMVALGILATGLIEMIPDREVRVETAESFCALLRKNAGIALN